MDFTDVYEDLGMVQLGDCNCPEPLIMNDGRKVWASAYGRYSREVEACDNWKPAKDVRGPAACGNCKFWEATEHYESTTPVETGACS